MALKFKCPDCRGNRIECVFDGPHSLEVTDLNESGDFEYGEYQSEAVTERWQCLNCGFVLRYQDGAKENILDVDDVVMWIKQNCEQEGD